MALNVEHTQVKSSIVCAKNSTDMLITSNRLDQKKNVLFFFLRKRLTILDRFGGLWLAETYFRR